MQEMERDSIIHTEVLPETHPLVWQYLTKEHLEMNTGSTIPDDVWEDFVNWVDKTGFASEVSSMVSDFFSDYCTEENVSIEEEE
jgi:hypothetical protein